MEYHKRYTTPLYFSQNDFLRLGITNAATGITITFSGQFMLTSGEIIPISFPIVPATDRSETVQRPLLGEGWLLHLCAVVTGGTARKGQTYVTACAQYGGGTVGLRTVNLLSAYATMDFQPSWPHGPLTGSLEGPGIIRSITGTNPAAGVEISDTVPTGARWRLLGTVFTLVTDVAVPVRQVTLILDDGVTTLWSSLANATQAASLTRNYNYYPWYTLPTASGTEIFGYVPPNLILMAGFRIRTSTSALVALDNYGAPQLLVEEWLEL